MKTLQFLSQRVTQDYYSEHAILILTEDVLHYLCRRATYIMVSSNWNARNLWHIIVLKCMWQAWGHFWLAVAHVWLSRERQVTHESEIPKRTQELAKLSKLKEETYGNMTIGREKGKKCSLHIAHTA